MKPARVRRSGQSHDQPFAPSAAQTVHLSHVIEARHVQDAKVASRNNMLKRRQQAVEYRLAHPRKLTNIGKILFAWEKTLADELKKEAENKAKAKKA